MQKAHSEAPGTGTQSFASRITKLFKSRVTIALSNMRNSQLIKPQFSQVENFVILGKVHEGVFAAVPACRHLAQRRPPLSG